MANWTMEAAAIPMDLIVDLRFLVSDYMFNRVVLDNPPFTMIQSSESNINYSLDMTNRGHFTSDFEKFMIYRQGGMNLIDVARKVSNMMSHRVAQLRAVAKGNASHTEYILGLREVDPWKMTQSLNHEQNILRIAAQLQLEKRDPISSMGHSALWIRQSQLNAIKGVLKSYIDDRFTDYREGTVYTVGVPSDMLTKFRGDTGNRAGLLVLKVNANRIFSDNVKLKNISFTFDPDLFMSPNSLVYNHSSPETAGDSFLQNATFYRWAVDHSSATYPATMTPMNYTETKNWLMDRHAILPQEADRIMKNHVLNEALRLYNLLTAGVDTNEYNFPIDYNINEFYVRSDSSTDDLRANLEALEGLSGDITSAGGNLYGYTLETLDNVMQISPGSGGSYEALFTKTSAYGGTLTTSQKHQRRAWMGILSNYRYSTDYNIGRIVAAKNFGRVFNLYININDFPLDEENMNIATLDQSKITQKTDSMGNTYYYVSTREEDTGNILLNDNLAQYDFTVEFK